MRCGACELPWRALWFPCKHVNRRLKDILWGRMLCPPDEKVQAASCRRPTLLCAASQLLPAHVMSPTCHHAAAEVGCCRCWRVHAFARRMHQGHCSRAFHCLPGCSTRSDYQTNNNSDKKTGALRPHHLLPPPAPAPNPSPRAAATAMAYLHATTATKTRSTPHDAAAATQQREPAITTVRRPRATYAGRSCRICCQGIGSSAHVPAHSFQNIHACSQSLERTCCT